MVLTGAMRALVLDWRSVHEADRVSAEALARRLLWYLRSDAERELRVSRSPRRRSRAAATALSAAAALCVLNYVTRNKDAN